MVPAAGGPSDEEQMSAALAPAGRGPSPAAEALLRAHRMSATGKLAPGFIVALAVGDVRPALQAVKRQPNAG